MSWIEQLAPEHVQQLTPYQSARRIGGSGNVWINANEAPSAPLFLGEESRANRYPEPQPAKVVQQYAEYSRVGSEQITVCRGADEGIELLIRTFCSPGDGVLICPPTYGMYSISARTCGVTVKHVPLSPQWQLDVETLCSSLAGIKLVFICSPNNPTGNLIDRHDIETVIRACSSQALVVIDEAYIEFCPEASCVNLLDKYDNVVILRTLSKAFALAGIRCGFTLASRHITNMLQKVIAPYPLALPIAEIAEQALSAEGVAEMKGRVIELNQRRNQFLAELERIPGVQPFPGAGNYILAHIRESSSLFQKLWDEGVIVRDQTAQLGLNNCLRFSIGSEQEMRSALALLRQNCSAAI